MKTKKIFVTCGFFMVLLVLPYLAAGDAVSLWTDELFTAQNGVPFTNWYDVADWEVRVCMFWGGDNDPNEVFGDTMVGDVFHNLVVTLQGEVRDPLPEEFESHSDERLYEISWYIQPIESDDDVNYEVYFIEPFGGKQILASGNSNYVNPGRDYLAEYSTANYTKVKLRYWNDDINEVLEVPIVE